MPRFVVLSHRTPPGYARGDHWDFMLEIAGALRTWALPTEPAAGDPADAELLADHRIEYLQLEGPLSGERGSVTRWDAGSYDVLEVSDDQWRVRLGGAKLQGVVTLRRSADQRWSFSFVPGVSSGG